MHPTTNRPGVVQEKIYAYLKSKKTGAASSELVEQVVRIKGASFGVGEKLIRTALSGDHRFTLDARMLWQIIEKNGTPISDAEIAVVSLFTARLAWKYGIIVEISAQKCKGNKLTEHFHTFINPGASILSSLHLPGDVEQEIKQGVPAEKGASALLHFLGDAVLAGYDIHAMVHQLNAVLGKTQETIENQALCLKLLTKKLLPSLNQKSLSDLTLFFKLPTIDTPNTEKEVGNMVNIFARCRELTEAQKIGTIEALLEFQYPTIMSVDFSKYAFDKAFLWSIPQSPGIYQMKDKSGKVIYVGKAKNLKDRVGSYFWNTANCLEKLANLLNAVYTIEFEITGSELAAMLLEYQLIKHYRPLFNQQIEVHERDARYGSLKNFVLILPSTVENCFELFFVKEGQPVQRYELLRDAVDLSSVEEILAEMFEQHPEPDGLTEDETGEIDIVLSWVDANKDFVNYINIDVTGNQAACLKLIKDYIGDDELLQKKQFRWK